MNKALEKSSTVSKPARSGTFVPQKGEKNFIAPSVQMKLNVGKANDPYEKEADAIADKVVERTSGGGEKTQVQRQPLATGITPFVQKKEENKAEERPAQKQEDESAQAKEEDKKPIQKQEEEPAQTKVAEEKQPVQKQGDESAQAKEEDKKPIQKQEEEPAQTKVAEEKQPVQKQEDESAQTKEEDKKPIQKQEDESAQAKVAEEKQPVQKQEDESAQAKDEDKKPIQKQEDEPAQAKVEEEKQPVQKQEDESDQAKEEDKKPIQKQEEKPAQTKVAEEKQPVQKQEDESAQTKEDDTAQTKAPEGNAKAGDQKDSHQFVEEKLKWTKGQGSPLSTQVKQMLEAELGVDLSGVRIHTGDNATQMSRALGAQAFANGKDIYFNEGKFNPHTSDGKHLLAHELTHTIQQGAVSEKKKAEDTFEEISHVQLSAMLDAAIARAQGEKGKVNAKAKNPDGTRVGHERLLEYFKTAFGANWDGSLEPNIKTYSTTFSQMEGRERDKMPSWCGIFIWWAYKQAGIPITDWVLGAPISENVGHYAPPHTPKPGDIGQKVTHQHFAMVTSSDGQNVTSINGNTAGTDNLGGQVEEKTEPASAFAVYYNPLGGNLNGSLPGSPAEEDLPVDRVKIKPQKAVTKFPGGAMPVSGPMNGKTAKKEKKEDKADRKKGLAKAKKEAVEEVLEQKAGETAPKSPEEDPAFQTHQKNARNKTGKLNHDVPSVKVADDAAKAAVPPSNEVESKAQDKKTDEMDSQEPKEFDAAGFKQALKEKLAEITPKNLEEADEFKENNKSQEVKTAASEGIKAEKENTAGPIEEKNQAPPDPTGIEPKEVTPLTDMPPGVKPQVSGAKGAAPKKKGDSEISMDEEAGEMDRKMADNNVTEEQLKNSNEPAFQKAGETKNETQTQVKASEKDYRKDEKQLLNKSEREAEGQTQAGVAAMFGDKKKSVTQVMTEQAQAKSKEEAERAKVAQDIDHIYQKTKTKVETTLNKLETDVNLIFDTGAALAKERFEKDVEKKMSDYKDKRYSGIRGKARWVRDLFADLPSEVNRFYEESRDQYIRDMDIVIDTVANIVATQLKEAKKAITDGKAELKEFVKSLPKNLQKFGAEAANSVQGKFDELEQSIIDKQNGLVDSLAQKYKENLDAVDARIKEMKEANKGLISKAVDAIEGVVKTILELKNMLLNILAKAAAVIDKIITDPIGFLKNLVAGIKIGLNNFLGNIATHLKNGFIGWLTGELAAGGIQLPATWDLKGIFTFIMQIIGLTWANIRMRAVKKLGEPIVKTLETAFDIFMVVKNEGLAGLWNYIKEKIDDLKTTVWDAIQNFLIEKVLMAGVTWIIGLLNPAAAFIKACKLIYDVVMFFVENARRLLELMNAVVDSVIDIANGALAGAAKKVEDALAKTVPIAIGFLASLIGVGGVGKKVKQIIDKIRKPINKAIDWVLDKAIKFAKKLGLDKLAKKVKGNVNKMKDKAKEKLQGKKKDDKKKPITEDVGKTVTFSTEKEGHKLYAKKKGKKVEMIVESTPMPVDKKIAYWKKEAKKLKAKNQVNKKEKIEDALSIASTAWKNVKKYTIQVEKALDKGDDDKFKNANAQLKTAEDDLSKHLRILFSAFDEQAEVDFEVLYAGELNKVHPQARTSVLAAVKAITEQNKKDKGGLKKIQSFDTLLEEVKKTAPVAAEYKSLLAASAGPSFAGHAFSLLQKHAKDELAAKPPADIKKAIDEIVAELKEQSRLNLALRKMYFNKSDERTAENEMVAALQRDNVGDHNKYSIDVTDAILKDGKYSIKYKTTEEAGKKEFESSLSVGQTEVIAGVPKKTMIQSTKASKLEHKSKLGIKGRGNVAPSGLGEHYHSAHLIADEFGGPGQFNSLNLVITTAKYNTQTMRNKEISIGKKATDLEKKVASKDIVLDMGVTAKLEQVGNTKDIIDFLEKKIELKEKKDFDKIQSELKGELSKEELKTGRKTLNVDYVARFFERGSKTAVETYTDAIGEDTDYLKLPIK